jgi:hypothetical protein
MKPPQAEGLPLGLCYQQQVLVYWEELPSQCHHDAEEHAATRHLVLEPEIEGSHRCRENTRSPVT